MKSALIPLFVMASIGVALAQAPDPARQTPMKGTKPGTVTVSGCVAEGTGQFMLNNAMVLPDAMKKEGGSTMPATGEKSMATYMLVGGENLKAHVGHKVEVTGRLATMKPDEKTTAGSKELKAAELRVQSVKMVSATCP